MLLLLFTYLTSLGWKIPSAFTYSSTRMMLAALTALLFTIFLGPRCIKKLYELKTGQSIRVEDCPMLAQLHEKKKNTPTMGGVLILFSIFLALMLWMDLSNIFTVIFLLTIFWLGGIGAYDDYLKLKHKNSKGLSGRKNCWLKSLLQQSLESTAWCLVLRRRCKSAMSSFRRWLKNKYNPLSPSSQPSSPHSEYMTQYYLPFFKDPVFH